MRLSRQLGAADNRNGLAIGSQPDGAAEEQLEFRGGPAARAVVENAGAFDEELALFREEHRKPGDVEHLRVDVGLRKVGVRGEIDGEVGGDAVLQVLDAYGGHVTESVGVERLGGRMLHRGAHERLQSNPQTGADLAEAGQMAGLRYLVEREPAPGIPPVGELGLPADHAFEVDTPHRIGLARQTQDLERNLDLGHPPSLGNSGGRFPALVPVEVGDLAFVGDERVGLGAGRVGPEEIGVPVIVQRVEEDRHGVVVVEVVVTAKLGRGNP
jgi:hypothetical protein